MKDLSQEIMRKNRDQQSILVEEAFTLRIYCFLQIMDDISQKITR
jgi:hypothetical protein